jgi:hypothetical protein
MYKNENDVAHYNITYFYGHIKFFKLNLKRRNIVSNDGIFVD